MDWSNETYVRLYVRDTTTWLKLKWEGQCLLMQLLRKVDRSGRQDGIVDPVEDLSLVTGLPEDVVDRGLQKLLKHEVVEINEEILVFPNYVEAQTATKSDKQRQKESREKRRLEALNNSTPPASGDYNYNRENVTPYHRTLADTLHNYFDHIALQTCDEWAVRLDSEYGQQLDLQKLFLEVGKTYRGNPKKVVPGREWGHLRAWCRNSVKRSEFQKNGDGPQKKLTSMEELQERNREVITQRRARRDSGR